MKFLAIHGLIGASHGVLYAVICKIVVSDTSIRNTHGEIVGVLQIVFFNLLLHYIYGVFTILKGSALNKHTEFIAADSIASAQITKGFLHNQCTVFDIFIALLMTKSIIAFFKIIQIKHNQEQYTL